jgi:AcrR family transcriptional regulator
MARPSNADQRRRELLPLIAKAFSELGYRRTTTAELAARCGVQENILYRLWPDKKTMFVAAIEFLFWRRMGKWKEALDDPSSEASVATRLIELTGKNLGEQGLYRIIFAALSETEDPDVKQTLHRLYRAYHERVETVVSGHREKHESGGLSEDEDTAWALLGLVAFMNIVIDLDLMSSRKRRQFFSKVAFFLLDGAPP